MKFTRIKGQDKPQNIVRLPRLGKLRLGFKNISKKTGKEYPIETDYFVVPPEVQDKFGPKPKILPVMIPVENEEMFLRQYYAVYDSNQKLKCQGDGETAERRIEGRIEKMGCPTPDSCDYAKEHGCRSRTDLMVVLPDINMGGVYQISTGSINSDIDIRSGIEMAKYLFGRISWVPMQITREERKIPDPGTGKMQTHWPVRMYPVATIAETNIIRQDTNRILERQETYSLPEPVIEGELPDTPIEEIEEATDVANQKKTVDLYSKEEIIITLSTAPDLETLDDLWRSCLPYINKMPNPHKVKIGMARDKRATQLKSSAKQILK